ncbi:unnamed protein product [Caenorhabditis sp. 36 PRJEB53466]|nr:unnamed protein product [Caenorhabditis sp. 36 PRJEB53466]
MASNSTVSTNPMTHNYDFNLWNGTEDSMSQQTPNMKPPPKRSNRPTKRTTFTPEQVTLLELEFAKNEYICKDRRGELAQIIDLTECQVKTWFQNRRTKKRRCNSPLRKGITIKTSDRTPSPYLPPAPAVPNLHALFTGWPTQFTYPLPADQQNKTT